MTERINGMIWYVCVGGCAAYFASQGDLSFWEVIWKTLLVGNLIYLGYRILVELYRAVLSTRCTLRDRARRYVEQLAEEAGTSQPERERPPERHPLRVALEERGINLNIDVDDMPVTVIKVTQRAPDPDPDVEECDVWVDTDAVPARAYVRVKPLGRPPTWTDQGVNATGKVGIVQDDTLVLTRIVRSPALAMVVQNLTKAEELSDLTEQTLQALDIMDEDLARELCLMVGFDPDKWKDKRGRVMGGSARRTIDLG